MSHTFEKIREHIVSASQLVNEITNDKNEIELKQAGVHLFEANAWIEFCEYRHHGK